MLLSELLTKLTCGELEGEELGEAVSAITNAPSRQPLTCYGGIEATVGKRPF